MGLKRSLKGKVKGLGCTGTTGNRMFKTMPKTFVIVSEALTVCPQLIFDQLRQSNSLCDNTA